MIGPAILPKAGQVSLFFYFTCLLLVHLGAPFPGPCQQKSFHHLSEQRAWQSPPVQVSSSSLSSAKPLTPLDWINNFIIGLITPPLVRETGFGAYVFFAVFCLLSFAWVWFSVPETNGKSLEEMDSVFKDRTGVADIAKKDRILAEVYNERQLRS